MKAIETVYQGYRFRSRLEARWAVFFDAIGWKWEYEKEGFELPSGRYLPDFFVRVGEARLWVEIKGERPNDMERRLCRELHLASDTTVLLVDGLPGVNPATMYALGGLVLGVGWCKQGPKVRLVTGLGPVQIEGLTVPVCTESAPVPFDAARMARFEFGQSGLKRGRKRSRGRPGSKKRRRR